MGGEWSTGMGSLLPAWTPSEEYVASTNMAWLMHRAGVESYEALHTWSVRNREAYWAAAIERLGLRFQEPYHALLDLSRGVEAPSWLVGAGSTRRRAVFKARWTPRQSSIRRRAGTSRP